MLRISITLDSLPLDFFPVSQEVFQLIHELLDIFELPIDRGKTDISYPIETVEFLHHLFTDLRTPDLPLRLFLEIEFDTVGDLFDDIDADRPLLAGFLQTIEDLGTIEGLSPPIFFDDRRQGILCPLTRSKSLLATEAFPPSPDRLLVLAFAGIDDFALRMITERTFHVLNVADG